MTMQLCLSILLSGTIIYLLLQHRRSPLISRVSVVAAFAGLYLVWAPGHANVVAAWMGVGRGADLILYLWVVMSFLMVINLHLKIRSTLELATDLARAVAITNAEATAAIGRRDHGSTAESTGAERPSA